MKFLAEHFRKQRISENDAISKIPEHFREVVSVHFDELESWIHSKCLPVTLALAVHAEKRKILSLHIDTIPAKGKLAEISRKKYGFRKNRSKHALQAMFNDLKSTVHPNVHFRSDMKSTYHALARSNFPNSKHTLEKSRRAAIVGFGELKEKGFDPLFALNHTAAMIRYGVSRMARRTWCTSKTIQGLRDHLELYIHFHNTVLTQN